MYIVLLHALLLFVLWVEGEAFCIVQSLYLIVQLGQNGTLTVITCTTCPHVHYMISTHLYHVFFIMYISSILLL